MGRGVCAFSIKDTKNRTGEKNNNLPVPMPLAIKVPCGAAAVVKERGKGGRAAGEKKYLIKSHEKSHHLMLNFGCTHKFLPKTRKLTVCNP